MIIWLYGLNLNEPIQLTMKNLIFVFYVFLITTSQIKSQDYTPFDLTDTKWVMSHLVPSAGNNATITFFEVYTKGDTIINGEQYTNITTKNLCKLKNTPDSVIVIDDFIKEELDFGAIREDDKKVYFYRFDDGVSSGYFNRAVYLDSLVDHLLYDFNATVGDTIHHSSTLYTIITETYELSDGIRIYEYINSGDESFPNISGATIKEGIGSGDGLFAAFDGYFTELICYKSDGPLDGIACSACKNYVTDTEDIFITELNVLYPNPAYSQLFIQEDYADQIERIAVYNIQGQKIKVVVYTQGDYSIDLDILNLPPGMVIFELEFDNGQRKLEKIVVQR